MKTPMLALAALVVLFGPISEAWSADDARAADIKREMTESVERMMAIWPGVYDNAAQMAVNNVRGFTSWRDGGHAFIRSVVVPVDLPAIGENLLYVEDSLDGDPTNVFRQRLYKLGVDDDRGAVGLTLFSFNDPKSVEGAYRNLALLSDLKQSDLRNRPGCEMLFHQLGDGFSGAFDHGACTTDEGLVADNRIFIAPGHYWFSDQFGPADAPRPHVSIGQNWHRLLPIKDDGN